jgi:hypothetical protein
METLKNFLWPIVLVGGLGGFIDFLIGKAGQARAKDFLSEWWIRFDDVHWRNFGRMEGLLAAQLIERWFGGKMWGLRRIMVFCALLIFFLLAAYLAALITKTSVSCYYCKMEHPHGKSGVLLFLYLTTSITTPIFYFTISIMALKSITLKMANLCHEGEARNLVVFLAMLSISYIMLMYISPVVAGFREYSKALDDTLGEIEMDFSLSKILFTFSIQNYLERGEIDRTALFATACSPSLCRFLLSMVFVGSFVLKPLVMQPVNFVWRRIVESEKPVFTVIFGGAAAFATVISEAAKHL